jgi:transcriptional regulator with XRE-family HTH domain
LEENLRQLSAVNAESEGEPLHAADVAVGGRIRHFRRARGDSLQEVSKRAGVSVGLISQIERGVSSASVRVLARISDALMVTIADLLDDDGQGDDGRVVARASERKRLDLKQSHMTKELLTPFRQLPHLDIFLISLDPGGCSGEEDYTHEGEEAGLVLGGGIELSVDGRKYVLGEGDTFRFASRKPHRFNNPTKRRAQVLWVNYRDN